MKKALILKYDPVESDIEIEKKVQEKKDVSPETDSPTDGPGQKPDWSEIVFQVKLTAEEYDYYLQERTRRLLNK